MRSRFERILTEVRQPDGMFIMIVGILVTAISLFNLST
jgi:hypothetical protein